MGRSSEVRCAAGLSDTLIDAILKVDRDAIPHPYSVILDTIDVVLEYQVHPGKGSE